MMSIRRKIAIWICPNLARPRRPLSKEEVISGLNNIEEAPVRIGFADPVVVKQRAKEARSFRFREVANFSDFVGEHGHENPNKRVSFVQLSINKVQCFLSRAWSNYIGGNNV